MGYLGRVIPALVLKPAKALVQWFQGQPPLISVDFGGLQFLEPFSRTIGADRGLAIDRFYIERFPTARRANIRGRVLEIGEDAYTRRLGGDQATRSNVLHVDDANRQVTIVGDLAGAPHIPDDSFDCIILTQTLHLVFGLQSAMRTLHRISAPGGVRLMTMPRISQVTVQSKWGKPGTGLLRRWLSSGCYAST